MVIKTLDLNLGSIGGNPSNLPIVDPPDLLPGYYGPGWLNGIYYPLGFYVPLVSISGNPWVKSPSVKVDVWAGNTLRINLTFKYKGPSGSRDFYAAVIDNDKSGSSPGEWLNFNGEKSIPLPTCTVWTTITGKYVDIIIPSEIWLIEHTGEDGAVYVKVMDGAPVAGENCTPFYYDAVHIVPVAGEFKEMEIITIAKVG